MKNYYYYQDAFMQQFDAQIIEENKDSIGRYVVLSNTAFYPTGGGQPHDTGLLNGVEVYNVEEVDGEIRHYINGTITSPVHGQLNFERRFDHMQQHTGQHILTAAFVELFDLPTLSFHLGNETVTIDLDCAAVTEEQLQRAEQRANDIILENRPIKIKWVNEEEAKQYPLRKQLTATENIRLVIIPDFDYNGCGGTHPHSTGEVSAIKILSTEKQKKKTRVHFVCGNRVLQNLHWRKQQLSTAAKKLSVPETDVAQAVEKLMQHSKQLEKQLIAFQEEKIQMLVAQLAASEEMIIQHTFENYKMQQIQKIARMISQQQPTKAFIFFSTTADQIQFVCAKGDACSLTISMRQLASTLFKRYEGKGGGSDSFAQGSFALTENISLLLKDSIKLLNA